MQLGYDYGTQVTFSSANLQAPISALASDPKDTTTWEGCRAVTEWHLNCTSLPLACTWTDRIRLILYFILSSLGLDLSGKSWLRVSFIPRVSFTQGTSSPWILLLQQCTAFGTINALAANSVNYRHGNATCARLLLISACVCLWTQC